MLTAAVLLTVAQCYSATHYVKSGGTGDGSSWSNAAGDLQQTIDNAQSGDEIWIAAGTYKPTTKIYASQRTSLAFILKEGVSLYGGFSGTETAKDERQRGGESWDFTNATILSADDDNPDEWNRLTDSYYNWWLWDFQGDGTMQVPGTKNNSAHVLYCKSEFATATAIDGLTLTGANANVTRATPAGGALYALGNIQLSNCRIVENSAYYKAENFDDSNTYGGAVYLKGTGGASIKGCLFERNYAHSAYGNALGGAIWAGGNTTVSDCTFIDCTSTDFGGGVYLKGANVSLQNCSFKGCYGSRGGAVYIDGANASDLVIEDCRSVVFGGGAINKSGKLSRAIIRGCSSDTEAYGSDNGGLGGGLYNDGGYTDNCAIFNSFAFKGGGVYSTGGTLEHCTVVNNTQRFEGIGGDTFASDDNSHFYNSITETAEASNFNSPVAFSGLPTENSQWETLRNADWSLMPGSAFIDSASDITPTSSIDLAGNPRVAGAMADRGAYEYQGGGKVPTIVLTFKDGTQNATIGVGGATGYEFTIDWGNGEEITYSSASYHSHALTGNTVKIYGSEIQVLQAQESDILSADVSNAPALTRIMLGGNGMTSLTLGNHPSLTGIYAGANKLTSINVAGCPALRVLSVEENLIEGSIDCSAMAQLSKVDISNNKVQELILPNHSTLYEVACAYNELTQLDVAGRSGLAELTAHNNQIHQIDLSGLTSLESIYLGENGLESIDISGAPSLETLQLAGNNLTAIDLSHNTALTGIYLFDNNLQSLDLTRNTAASWVNISNNQIADIDLTKCSRLSLFIASGNRLSQLNLKNNPSVVRLELDNNMLTSIDVSRQTSLSQFYVRNNLLTSLDLSKNGYLYWLRCAGNNIATLDLSKNTYLQFLDAAGNNLTTLDLSKQTGLQGLFLEDNNMDADAINSIMSVLPNVSSVSVGANNEEFARKLNISFMPGTAGADKSVAEAKGWTVIAETPGAGAQTPVELNIQADYAGNLPAGVAEVTVEYANEEHTSLYINNFFETGNRVVAAIDGEGNIKIAPQTIGGSTDGNYYMIVSKDAKNGSPFEIFNTFVAGRFENGMLSLNEWNIMIVPPSFSENLGTLYTDDLTTKFYKSNGTFSWTTEDGAERNSKVYAVADTDNKTMTVYGWGDIATVTLSQTATTIWTASKDCAFFTGSESYSLTTPDNSAVVSQERVNARTLRFGAWQLTETGGAVSHKSTQGTLSLDFPLPEFSGITVTEGSEVIKTIYINAAGIRSSQPFDGFNIIVERRTDGSTTTRRAML